MKTILLSLCLAGSLFADEAEEAPIEELKIDPLLSVKEEFSEARKNDWDFVPEKKKVEFQHTTDGYEFNFTFQPPDDQRLERSAEQAKSFRNDISEVERAKSIERLNEMDRVQRPKSKSKSK